MNERMSLQDFARRALRVPFLEHGRSWEGWDCWGLVRLAYHAVFVIPLPSFADRYASTLDRAALAALIEAERAPWRPVDCPRPGDVVLLRVLGRPVHLALVLDARHILHTEAKCGTMIEDLRGAFFAGKVEGIYRHVDLA